MLKFYSSPCDLFVCYKSPQADNSPQAFDAILPEPLPQLHQPYLQASTLCVFAFQFDVPAAQASFSFASWSYFLSNTFILCTIFQSSVPRGPHQRIPPVSCFSGINVCLKTISNSPVKAPDLIPAKLTVKHKSDSIYDLGQLKQSYNSLATLWLISS